MNVGKIEKPERPVSRSREIAVCVIGRRENRYAREFVEHYKALGFDRILLCDNNREGEERFEDVLQDYIDEGFVEVFDYRDRPGVQCTAYNDIYAKYGDWYRWMAFFDFDEHLSITSGRDIHEAMAPYSGQDCVFVNWMNFGDNGLVKDDGRPLKERFTEPLPVQYVQYEDIPENHHVKSIVRGGIGNMRFSICPHLPANPTLRCVTATGESCRQSPYQKPDFTVMYLRHYITKTIEEWCRNKWQKGAGTHLSLEAFRNLYTGRFFKYNKMTAEKEDMMLDILGTAPYKPARQRNILIVNYNTQRLTMAAIRSINKHTKGCHIYVFDNSDRIPFQNPFRNVTVIDNTRKQYIDFEKMIEDCPDRIIEEWGSNFGSAKHCRSVDICLDLIPDGFLLMDSDILVKKDLTPFFDEGCVWTGLVNNAPSRWCIQVPRVLPFACYLNVPMMRRYGVRYYNRDKMYALVSTSPEKAYDTGAWFYEDCNNHGLVGRHIQINDYIIHLDHGSWLEKDQDEWLEEHKDLYL